MTIFHINSTITLAIFAIVNDFCYDLQISTLFDMHVNLSGYMHSGLCRYTAS